MALIIKLISLFVLLFANVTCRRSERRKNLIDLSHELNEETPYWITARPYELKVLHNGTSQLGDTQGWFQFDEIYLSTHTSTHLDAPCHFYKGKWSIADIPHENLVDIPIAVVDVSQQCLANRDYEATVEDVKEWEKSNGKIPEKSVLIIKTGWARFWPNRLEYFGTESKNADETHFPGVDPDLAEWLVDHRDIVGLGIDGPSVDNGPSKSKKTHQIMGEHNIYNIENIARSVHNLPPLGAKMIALPIKLSGASGVPVQIVAYLDSVASLQANAILLFSLAFLFIIFQCFRSSLF